MKTKEQWKLMFKEILSRPREALLNGDKILSENYLQHSEHFSRILISQENLRNQRENYVETSNDEKLKAQIDKKEVEEPNTK